MLIDDEEGGRGNLLRCHVCGRENLCSDAAILWYRAFGWPTCCGVVMDLFVEVVRTASLAGVRLAAAPR